MRMVRKTALLSPMGTKVERYVDFGSAEPHAGDTITLLHARGAYRIIGLGMAIPAARGTDWWTMTSIRGK